MRRRRGATGLAAVALGLVHAASFAPLASGTVSIVAMAGLYTLLLRAPGVRAAALLGYLFALATFTGGLGWLYVAMHDYGAMAAPLAALGVLLFAAFLALYPMLAAALAAAAARRHGPHAFIAAAAGGTVLAEWLRGWVFTGFSWLSPGYAQIDSALAGFAPWLGVYGVGGIAAGIAAALAIVLQQARARHGHGNLLPTTSAVTRRPWLAPAVAVALPALGLVAAVPHWSEPSGAPIHVRLLQGNVEQSVKFDPEHAQQAMQRYVEQIVAEPADLTVLPETAWTVPPEQTPAPLAQQLTGFIARTGTAVAIGAPTWPVPQAPGEAGGVANSIVVPARPGAPRYVYTKHHLVPFGEFVPPGFRWFVDRMAMPLGDMVRGPLDAPNLPVAGQRIAFGICYEDLFGEELLPALRGPDGATILANATNIAWYGRSTALPQHLAIARMRALETARPVVRATNTGTTAVIDPRGHVVEQLPVLQRAALSAHVQGHAGLTPYARTGNAPALLLALLTVGAALWPRRRGKPDRAAPGGRGRDALQ